MSSIITIVDSICGAGKTQWAIQMINEAQEHEKFIYITPFLDEVKRIKKHTNRQFIEPNQGVGKGRKYDHFKELIIDGKNIVSTHALFTSIDSSILESIQYNRYTLILDEVINVLETKIVSSSDWEILMSEKLIAIEEKTNKIRWTCPDYHGEFDEIKQLADSNNLYLHTRSENSKNKVLLVWTFPIEVFEAFDETYNLTYMFDGQLQKYYFDMYAQKYIYKSVLYDGDSAKYRLVDYNEKLDNREEYKNLINIYSGHLNDIGEDYNSLSKAWLDRSLKNGNIKILKNNILNWYMNIVKGKSKQNLWTTLKGNDDKRDTIRLALTGAGYSNGFLSCNARATNDYRERFNCCYALNKFLNPMDKGFFEDKGVTVNEDMYSLSELVQWLFRSSIRDKKMINLYIPSSRMRKLFIDWANYKI